MVATLKQNMWHKNTFLPSAGIRHLQAVTTALCDTIYFIHLTTPTVARTM
jgi:hypothetical protein